MPGDRSAAGRGEALAERPVGGAVEEAAARRPGAAVTIVTSWPRLGEVERRAETAPVVEVVEDEDAPAGVGACRRARRGSTTTSAPSTPGSRSTIGSARWNPVRGGREPGRHDDLVGADGRDVRRASPPRRAGRPRRAPSSRRPYQARRSRDLAARRLQAGEPELAAERRAALDERHAMAALRRDPRRLQPGRPAADDQHAPRTGRRLEPVAAPLRTRARPTG